MPPRRVRIHDLKARKQRGEKIAVLTAYDATLARLLERAGIDVLLVGDSVGMAVLGHDSTIPVTLDAMVHHTAAVARGTATALVIADMPFLTYQATAAEAVRNAGKLIQAGAAAVKIEGGRPVQKVVRRLVDAGIPVMGHLGVLPQSVHQLGGYRRRGASAGEADAILRDAHALEEAGAFALVLESIPPELARSITAALRIPTIGIGAGPACDGQVLVSYDMLGLVDDPPPFAKTYARLAATIELAAKTYAEDVRLGRFPEASQPALSTATGAATADKAGD
jgi:3-methyl-2-oxobutanoate hydroxymethyltransferase